jgi:hypothetical protein
MIDAARRLFEKNIARLGVHNMIVAIPLCHSVNHRAAITKGCPISASFIKGGKFPAYATYRISSANSGKINGMAKAVSLMVIKIFHKYVPPFSRLKAFTMCGNRENHISNERPNYASR